MKEYCSSYLDSGSFPTHMLSGALNQGDRNREAANNDRFKETLDNYTQAISDLCNDMARQGWTLKSSNTVETPANQLCSSRVITTFFIFEREVYEEPVDDMDEVSAEI